MEVVASDCRQVKLALQNQSEGRWREFEAKISGFDTHFLPSFSGGHRRRVALLLATGFRMSAPTMDCELKKCQLGIEASVSVRKQVPRIEQRNATSRNPLVDHGLHSVGATRRR